MGDRLTELRRLLGKDGKSMSQQVFASAIGVARSTLANFESGRNDPADSVIQLICMRFNVNENWLRNGIGDVFVALSKEDQIAEFVGRVMRDQSDSVKKRLILGLAQLDDDGWDFLDKFLDSIQARTKED